MHIAPDGEGYRQPVTTPIWFSSSARPCGAFAPRTRGRLSGYSDAVAFVAHDLVNAFAHLGDLALEVRTPASRV